MDKRSDEKEWIGFDLDGTLAKYDKWSGFETIGEPIESMIEVCRAYIRLGDRVKIFTARVAGLEDKKRKISQEAIETWCIKHLGKKLEITAEKDRYLKLFYDDRAISVDFNKGDIISDFEKILSNIKDSQYSIKKE